MNYNHQALTAAARDGFGRGVGNSVAPRGDLFGMVAAMVQQWRFRHRTRRDLEQLDAHLLSDIGLDPAAVRTECSKPFWQP